MSEHDISDDWGRFSLKVQVHGPVLQEAMDHPHAEEVIKCAVIMALSVLAQDDPWPGAALVSMSSFMTEMKSTLIGGLC